jgi:hypothetical protein
MVSGALASFAPVSHVLQRGPQLMPGAMDVRLYGSKREIQGRGNLLVRTSLDVPEHDARSILGAKAADRPFDGRAQLARLELVERRFLLANDVERRRLDGV